LRIELLTSVGAIPAWRYSTFGVWPRSMLCLPGGLGRPVRLMFFRGPGRDFTERDCALLQVSSRAAAVTRAFQGAAVAAAT
jgi:hypothetical protein